MTLRAQRLADALGEAHRQAHPESEEAPKGPSAAEVEQAGDGASIVGEPDSVRSAWLDAQKFAARLDRLVPVLCAAAELAGIYTGDDTMLLPPR